MARRNALESLDEWRKLKNDLAVTRLTVLDLMPEQARGILRSHLFRPKEQSAWRWAETASEQMVELCTDVRRLVHNGYTIGAPRALCPLCGQGTSSPHEYGFALPDGLVRHLRGTYNSRQCPVFKVAFDMALEQDEDSRPASQLPNWAAMGQPNLENRRIRPYKPRKKKADPA